MKNKDLYTAAARTAKSAIRIYSTLALANRAANVTAAKAQHVILGEEGDYLVVTPAIGARLIKAGYQYA